MVFDDVTAELGLSLGCHDKPANYDHDLQGNQKKSHLKYDPLLSFDLTLGPSDEAEPRGSNSSSPSGAVSSFSNSSSLKRADRDITGSGEETERVSEEPYEDQAGSPRKKLRLTKDQSATLEDSFKQHTTLNPKQKLELAKNLNLRPRQVEVWFQNRRARTKLKQTEADCELLKKCCETLKEENRRLHKELQELQLMKETQTAPFYIQFPTATLTACPSCSERIGNDTSCPIAGDHHHKKLKPHLFNPFTHPSTAC
ncbi:homeobox-leucine zipper protein HAT9-like [Argentina anserina]|uniref:homeobox-leucine zipper protein HAT9-like n=1 Tax=Argentina anserina TaxID=57926 RepID=UPI0021763C26|nr:homeobox-leucine zipper protein HAT9-like [Potentilla anserina]